MSSEQLSIDGRPAVPGRPTTGTGEVFEVTPLFVAVASIRGQLALETDEERPTGTEKR
jgi:hypothetical protein